MLHPEQAVVTGAFSYTGRYVARRLLKQGVRVRTLTRRFDRLYSFGGMVEAAPLDFSNEDRLCRSMQGAGVLYNTYWVRFEHAAGPPSPERSRTPGRCSRPLSGRASAGLSTSPWPTPRPGPRCPTSRARGQVEDMLEGLGVPYAIIRPTLVFGLGGLMLNNIAWALSALPVLPRLRERPLQGPAGLRRRPCGPGGACGFTE